MTKLYFAVALAFICVSMLATIVIAKRPAPTAAPVPVAEAMKDESNLSSKGDLESRPIRTIPIDKPVTAVPAPAPENSPPRISEFPVTNSAAAEAEPAPPPAKPHGHILRMPQADICTRYGGHKVLTRNGKSWRCWYPRRGQ